MSKIAESNNLQVHSDLITGWFGSGSFITIAITSFIAFFLWVFRLAISDKVKREIEPLKKDINEIKVSNAAMKAKIDLISENIHLIKNYEGGEQGTLALILDHLQKTDKK